VNARTSSRLESAPWPGMTFTSAGSCAGRFFHRVDNACTLPPLATSMNGKPVAHEVVAHVHNIVFREENDGVAVRVAGGKIVVRECPRRSGARYTSCSKVMIGSAALAAGFTSILTEPPFPAVPPVSSRLRTLSLRDERGAGVC